MVYLMKRILLFVLIAHALTSCDVLLCVEIPNNSDVPVYMYLPQYYSVTKHETYDSTISFPLQKLKLIPPGKSIYADLMVGRPMDDVSVYMEQFPLDTVHFFIFDPEVLDNHGWNQIKDGYMVLKRYDLTTKDLRNEKVLNGLWPPTPKVAHIKQYPPYAPAML